MSKKFLVFRVAEFPGMDFFGCRVCFPRLSGCSPFLGDDNNETFSNITRGEVAFPDEYFAGLSPALEDFILSLLVLDPK